MELLLTVAIFGLCMAGMAVGVIFSGRRIRGTCGDDEVVDVNGEAISCGACPRKESEVCPSDDPLVRLAQSGNPSPRAHH